VPRSLGLELMTKKTKGAVDYRAGECCFHCQAFARPTASGEVLGHCVRVEGKIHPGDTCRLFEWAEETDDDGDGGLRVEEIRVGV
jgi:hypothetical protein